MSVRTPILTTSSEICAFAAPPHAATTRPAATAAANDFMMFFSLGFLGLLQGTLLRGSRDAGKADFRPSAAARPVPDCAFSRGIAVLGSRPAGPPACRIT